MHVHACRGHALERAHSGRLRQEVYRYDAAHAFANERSGAYDVGCANQSLEPHIGVTEGANLVKRLNRTHTFLTVSGRARCKTAKWAASDCRAEIRHGDIV